jgi:predicted esterase
MRSGAGLLLAAALTGAAAAEPGPGFHAKTKVRAPTRLDWTFTVATQSQAKVPPAWLGGHDSTAQQYQLFVPARKDKAKKLPLIVFVSPGSAPSSWSSFERLCRARGFLFAAPSGAGNDCPAKKRVRIVLDVLDDVRRNYPTDPDRTYIAGFSGGGRIACAIAFALPELFGGVMPICASGDLREESWLRQRVGDRLRVALLTGATDFNRGEVERLRGPYLKEVGMTARVWVQPGLGHGMPNDKVLGEALTWLDEGAPARRKLAEKYPASVIAGDAAPGREELAKALLAEGKARLKERETLYSGLMQVQGTMKRWPDTAAGKAARALLLEEQDKKERPWEADDLAEQRRFLVAKARALDAYVSGPLPPIYLKRRPEMAKQAVELWEQVVSDAPDSDAGKEGKRRIPELRKLLD